MKFKTKITAVIFLILVIGSIATAIGCSDFCESKCSVMPNPDMYEACLYGCCPGAS